LQRRLGARETIAQIAWLAGGIAMVALASSLVHVH
jgi:zinc and cadmium transporter